MHTFLVTLCAVGVAVGAPLSYTILPGEGYLTPEMFASLQMPFPIEPSYKLSSTPLTNIVMPMLPAERPVSITQTADEEKSEEPVKIEDGVPEPEKVYRYVTLKQGPDFQSYWANAQAYWASLQDQWQQWISNLQNNGVVAIFNPQSQSVRLIQNGKTIPLVLQK